MRPPTEEARAVAVPALYLCAMEPAAASTQNSSSGTQAASSGGDASIRLRGLAKTFAAERGQSPVTALKGIDLDVPSGEFMVLVGPSGCGKTTTLRLLAGLDEPTRGTIEIGGKRVNQVPAKDRAIAMVFQNYALYPHMTVFENLAFGLKVAKRPKAQIRQAVLGIAAALGLEPVLDRTPQALSGGQRQRVALGRAMVKNPRVFLFDEPLANLDPHLRLQMRAEILRLHAQLKTTVLYVTHDQVEAMSLGGRICVLREGAIVQVADPVTLYRQPANLFVAGFIGSPPMNLLPGRLQRHPDGLYFADNSTTEPLRIPLPAPLAKLAAPRVDQEVVFGLRPEHVSPAVPGAPQTPVPFTVEFVEHLGPESILHLKRPGTALLARVHGELRHRPGDPFLAQFQAEKAHLFDPATGNRLAES